MSTIAAITIYPIGFLGKSGDGYASESVKLESKYDEIKRDLYESRSIEKKIFLDDKITELDSLYRECSAENWDGYGAIPISKNTLNDATSILKMLNSTFLNFPMPELAPVPNGDLAFEWYDQGKAFIFSIDSNRNISYAGIFGHSKTHGSEDFIDFIPPLVIYNLKRMFPRP